MTGGVFLWKDGREVPDTMNVSAVQPEEMLISWDSGFGNNALGSTEDILGTDGTICAGSSSGTLRRRSTGRTASNSPVRRRRRRRRTCRTSSSVPRHCDPELPVRGRLPRLDCLPDGRGQLSPGPHDDMGSRKGRNHPVIKLC